MRYSEILNNFSFFDLINKYSSKVSSNFSFINLAMLMWLIQYLYSKSCFSMKIFALCARQEIFVNYYVRLTMNVR